jgi:hypothetical protein
MSNHDSQTARITDLETALRNLLNVIEVYKDGDGFICAEAYSYIVNAQTVLDNELGV